MTLIRNQEIILASADENRTDGWPIKHSETREEAAIRAYRAIRAGTGLLDWTPVLVKDGGRYIVEEADPSCTLWSAPDEDGETDVCGFDWTRHPGAIAG